MRNINGNQRYGLTVALSLAASHVQALIAQDGLWTGNDWYDEANEFGVVNGVPFSNNEYKMGRIQAAMSREGDPEDYSDQPNVQRVRRVFTQDNWNEGFPLADSLYSYEDFLKAVGLFPMFCNEMGEDYSDLDDVCRRELAGLFAHWGQETGKRDPSEGEFWTQGLYYLEEMACSDGFVSWCDYKNGGWSAGETAWPNQAGVQYYGRGPMQLSWNYNYGAFSNVFNVPKVYNSRMLLLENPDLVAEDGYTAFAAGIWFWMTPQPPKPSMHDVMTGIMIPNEADINAGFGANFGTTINIINGGQECGFVNNKATSRGVYYNKWLQVFGLPEESDVSCAHQAPSFPFGGYGDVPLYFQKRWDDKVACQLSQWQTQYSVMARDDYKRCVCDFYGQGEADCPPAEGTPIDDDEEEEEGSDDGDQADEDESGEDCPDPYIPDGHYESWETLQEIRDSPHYDDDNYSRTLFQVERELDFLERKVEELLMVAEANGLLEDL